MALVVGFVTDPGEVPQLFETFFDSGPLDMQCIKVFPVVTFAFALSTAACSGGDAAPVPNSIGGMGTAAVSNSGGVTTSVVSTTGAVASAGTAGAVTSASVGTVAGVTGVTGTTGGQAVSSTASGVTGSAAGFTASTGSGGSASTATTGDASSVATSSFGSVTSTTGTSNAAGGAATSGTSAVTDSTTATATTGGLPTEPVTVYLAGDSIVQTYTDTASTTDQAGWGQMLGQYFNDLVTVDNRAIGGRTARRFIDEGRLQDIADNLQAGDYLLVQFGTNDSNSNASATYTINGQTIPYYVDPATFKTYLQQYIQVAHDHSATPVLVTPTPRNSAYCTGGNGTGAYATAMRELAAAEGVALSDLNAKSVNYLMAICPAPTPEDFFFLRTDGTVDGTHFQENGARILAGFVAEGLADANVPLAQYLK